LTEGIGLPDDGKIGIYQLAPYDNPEEDYLVKRNNAIALRTYAGSETNIIVRHVDLPPHQQVRCNSINLAFVNHATIHSSSTYRTWIEVTYTDDTSEIVLDTGVHNLQNAINDGRIAGMLGGAGLTVNDEPQGGLLNFTDITSFENVAPNYPDIVFRPKLLYAMNYRMAKTKIEAGNAAIWELDPMIQVNPDKFLKRITINLRGPIDRANRWNRLFVIAISGDAVDMSTLIMVQ